MNWWRRVSRRLTDRLVQLVACFRFAAVGRRPAARPLPVTARALQREAVPEKTLDRKLTTGTSRKQGSLRRLLQPAALAASGPGRPPATSASPARSATVWQAETALLQAAATNHLTVGRLPQGEGLAHLVDVLCSVNWELASEPPSPAERAAGGPQKEQATESSLPEEIAGGGPRNPPGVPNKAQFALLGWEGRPPRAGEEPGIGGFTFSLENVPATQRKAMPAGGSGDEAVPLHECGPLT